MGRRSTKRNYAAGHRPLNLQSLVGLPRTVVGPGGVEYTVQRLGLSRKTYVCPGCNHVVAVGSKHVVAWENDPWFGREEPVAARRHWHESCWERFLR